MVMDSSPTSKTTLILSKSNFKMFFKTKEPNQNDWQRFVKEGLANNWDDNQSNVCYDFTKMSKMFGLSYIYWLEIQYRCFVEGGYAESSFEEMCKWNGNVPAKFFDKFK